MKKLFFILFSILTSSSVFAEEIYLLWKNNSLALNGISAADKSIEFANKNSIKKSESQLIIPFNKNNKEIIIDLNSSLNYKIKTPTNTFNYKSTSNNILLDMLYNRIIVFDIQNIGNYLLFLEDTKITCFNLEHQKPCSKSIHITKSESNINPSGEITILFKELFFYEDRTKNEIIQCPTGVAFNPKSNSINFCGNKTIFNLKNLD